jgi:uncharacterized protein YlxW (UPF0749 family)
MALRNRKEVNSPLSQVRNLQNILRKLLGVRKRKAMSKLFWQILKTTPAVALSSAVVASGSVFAQTVTGEQVQTTDANELLQQVDQYNQQGNSLDQVNSVTQFRDVQPTDWAYEALRGLVERYGCIAGYPNGTYRGDRALTRYEFAAGLYSCLLQIERLIAASDGQDGVDPGDLATLERLIAEFEAELATLGTRVDNLEARLGEVEENQFSTTTKLNGEVIFALADAFGGNDQGIAGVADADDLNTTLGYRTRLNFDTSFSGRDRLRTRLEVGNLPRFDNETGVEAARLGFDASTNNDVEIGDLNYRFPFGNRIRGHIGLVGFEFEDMASVANPYFESSGTGALSRFARRNPAVYRSGPDGAGVGVNVGITDSITFDAAYLTDTGSSSDPNEGLFGDEASYQAVGQVNLDLIDRLDLALTYSYAFFNEGNDVDLTGGLNPINNIQAVGVPAGLSIETSSYGAQANFQIADRISLGGWYGLTFADVSATDQGATYQNWAANVAILDLFKEGGVLGATFGQLPTITDSDGLTLANGEQDESYLLEVLYKYPLTDNILITPGAYAIFNPNNVDADNNDPVYVGVLRTTFKF